MMIITYSDSLFPDELRKIPDCPEALYVLGNTDLLATGCKATVIGARKADEAGGDAAYRLGVYVCGTRIYGRERSCIRV